jgi:ABC-type dipeptide/oligopeptide/nickel transport system permease component
MGTIILRRLLQAVPVLFIVVTLTFLLVRSAPGNPFSTEKKIPPEIMEELEKQYDLHGTMWHQYLQYMAKVGRGNLGISTQYRDRTVNEIIAQTLPVSMTLGSLAYFLALLFGITTGGWAAVRHNRAGDRILMVIALSPSGFTCCRWRGGVRRTRSFSRRCASRFRSPRPSRG